MSTKTAQTRNEFVEALAAKLLAAELDPETHYRVNVLKESRRATNGRVAIEIIAEAGFLQATTNVRYCAGAWRNDALKMTRLQGEAFYDMQTAIADTLDWETVKAFHAINDPDNEFGWRSSAHELAGALALEVSLADCAGA